ncbi:MAG: chorismate synthase [Bacteroidia bacterium]|nr:chorismate synthase [Bacteroidia bacterium]MDG2042266.1 chorismate synthase [Bacteroidia bacterium]
MNSFGKHIILTSYGESHGKAVGAILDGFPAGFEIDMSYIQSQLDRRKPGQSTLTTSRKESDLIDVQSGVFEGKTTGAPIHFQLLNTDAKPKDYDKLKDIYRPSHADFTYEAKYGIRDYRGGGRSSARITAGWVASGALVQDYLQKKQGINITSYVSQIGTVLMEDIGQKYTQAQVDSSPVRCPIEKTSEQMIQAVNQAKNSKDSLGGVITCVISGVKPGVGNPVFGKLNALLAHAMMSINATKGFEIGGGFDMASKLGSEVNDSFVKEEDIIKTKSNFSGGIQGGISNGMDIVFRVAFKPTSTIGVEQITLDNSHDKVTLEASGRHDPCVVPRAVPIIETMAALVLGDLII